MGGLPYFLNRSLTASIRRSWTGLPKSVAKCLSCFQAPSSKRKVCPLRLVVSVSSDADVDAVGSADAPLFNFKSDRVGFFFDTINSLYLIALISNANFDEPQERLSRVVQLS